MALLYSLIVRASVPLLTISSLFNKKISAWWKGRKGWKERLDKIRLHEEKLNVWFHCASLGEFEQGKPLMQQIAQTYPRVNLYVTFFSPSGYEIKKHDPLAFCVEYLPLDTPQNAKIFIELVRPSLAIFVKSELWPNFVAELRRKRVPRMLISARFYQKQALFAWYGRIFLKTLASFDFVYVQDAASQRLLNKVGISSVVAGDTRYDNVLSTQKKPQPLPLIERFVGSSKVLVVGSCWQEDLELICPYLNQEVKDLKTILAPHDVSESMISHIVSQLRVPAVRYSQLVECPDLTLEGMQVLIIDCIGILAHTYKYATVAYVGGAFKQGLHNILEPAAFGKPVLFGPNYDGFPEAGEMLSQGGGFSVSNQMEFGQAINGLLQDNSFCMEASLKNKQFIERKTGATEKIMTAIKTLLENKVNS